MSDLRLEQIKQTLINGQYGSWHDDIRLYIVPSRQYIQSFNYFIRNNFRTMTPVIMPVGKKLIKTSAQSLKVNSLISDSFKSALKLTIRTACQHGGKAFGKLIQEQETPAAAWPVEPRRLHHNELDVGTEMPPKPQLCFGRYKASQKHKLNNRFIAIKRSNVYYHYWLSIIEKCRTPFETCSWMRWCCLNPSYSSHIFRRSLSVSSIWLQLYNPSRWSSS